MNFFVSFFDRDIGPEVVVTLLVEKAARIYSLTGHCTTTFFKIHHLGWAWFEVDTRSQGREEEPPNNSES